MKRNNDSSLEETKARWVELREILRERYDDYSARFFALITPSIVFPLANGISDAMGYSLVDSPAREVIYAGGVALHQLRNRTDISPSNFVTGSLSDKIMSLSLTDGVLLTGASYSIGYCIGSVVDKVNDFFD